MRNKDLKKGKESTIGKIIYGFLLFMPLFAIGSACLISTFNMSGKEETKITYKYQSNEVNSLEDLVQGNIYRFKCDTDNTFFDLLEESGELSGFILYVNKFQTNSGNYDSDDIAVADNPAKAIPSFYMYLDAITIYAPNSDNYVASNIYIPDATTVELDFIFVLDVHSNLWANGVSRYIKYTNYNEIESVQTHNLEAQEVFYNAVDKVTESPLFSWTENSLIYTGISNTCTQLSITTTFIPLLLTYWLIISVVYILYDIILMILIILHNRVHRLQDSMT